MSDGLKCSLCSRSFPRSDLRYNPVGGGFRHQGSDYLCQQCWSVLCSQPWPAEQAAPGAGGAAACSPAQLGSGGQRAAPPAAGQNGALGLPPTAPLPLPQQHQAAFGSHPGHAGVLSAAAAAASHAALQRRCQSVADLQLALAGGRPARPSGWQPASMPEAPAILGSADDPRWGALAMAASAPDHHRTRSGAQRSQQMAMSGSAPVFSPLELKNMMDESSLEIFESQSHLLDPETRLQLQKQRQYLEWQNSMEESGPMRASLERTDSAGSGSGAPDVASLRQEVKALRAEREGAAQRVNELCQQLQEKKRQLYQAIQEREQLKERARAAEAKLKEYQEAMHCRLCFTAVRNCVVLPCLHFLYCDSCFKKHCTSSPTCPACSTPVTGFQTLMLL